MTTTTKRKSRQCSRCEGTDPGCNVCHEDPQEALEWPTREDIEFLRDEAEGIIGSKKETYAGVMIQSKGELHFTCYGYLERGTIFVNAHGPTIEETIDSLRKKVAKANPVAKLAAQARKQGFDIVKREGKA